MLVRFRGMAAQWGDGGEFHGWYVGPRWHAPKTAEEMAVVRACIARDSVVFWAPCGAEVVFDDGGLTILAPRTIPAGPLLPRP